MAQAVGVIITPLLTRLYEPQDFGAFGLFTAILMSASVVASWRYELAIPLAEDEDSAARVAVVGLAAVCATTLLTGAGVILGANLLHDAVPDVRGWVFTGLLPLGVAVIGTYQVFTYWTIRLRRYTAIARTKITQALVLAAVQLGAPLFHSGPVGLMLGDVLGRSAGTARLIRATLHAQGELIRTPSLARLLQTAKQYRRFPLLSASGALLNVLSWHAPTIMILTLFGVKAAGWFALTQRLIALPTAVLGQAVAQVYFGRVAELLRGDQPEAIRAVFSKASGRLFLLGVGPAIGLILFGPVAFALVFGSSWRPAGEYAQLMALMFMARMVANPVSQTLELLRFQSWQLASEAVRLTVVVASFAAAAVFGLKDTVTVGLYAGSMTLSYLLSYQLSRAAIRRLSTAASATP